MCSSAFSPNLYLHFPFCRRKCSYCALLSRPGASDGERESYVRNLADEIRAKVPSGHVFRTIYFGGGSPALCDLRPIFDVLKSHRGDETEFTVELHPLDVTEALLAALRAGGVNRISMGVQSFDDETLRRMGRLYTFAEAVDAFRRVKRVFPNAGIDLIVGYPDDRSDYRRLNAFEGLCHCSVYSLQLEEKTALEALSRRGKVTLPSDDAVMDQIREVGEILSACGLKRYEISNYALPGFECRHNFAVWRGEDYLGLGEGAAGRLGLSRTQDGAELERVTPERDKLERTLFRLRTREGLDTADYPAWRPRLDRFVKEGLLDCAEGLYKLTLRGAEVCDTILSALYPLILPLVLAVLVCGCATREIAFTSREAVPREVTVWYARTVGDTNAVVLLSTGEQSGDVHAPYRVGSVTKLFMSLAAADMHREGMIDLDAPLREYAAIGLPEDYATLTLRDLLSHRSGLPRELVRPDVLTDVSWALTCGLFDCNLYAGYETREEVLAALNTERWREAVRKREMRYSNVGYGLAWAVIAHRLKTDYREIFKSRVQFPLGLTETSFDPATLENVMPLVSGDIPWLKRRGEAIHDEPISDWYMPAGGLYASASDCQKMAAHYWPHIDAALRGREASSFREGEILGDLCVHRMPTGLPCLYRSGMIYGGSSFIGFDPESRLVVVILRNQTCWPDPVGLALLEHLRNPRH